jgi:peptidylprolyl isomerase domain and WD repeat-containing protein 1
MSFNDSYDCVVSADDGGMLEYWSPSSNYEKPSNVFDMKTSTNLFEFKKSKSAPTSITISPDGKQFATYSFPDRKVRVFDFETGKLHRTYDESLATLNEMQQAGTAIVQLENAEFEKRMSAERELDTAGVRRRISVIFDESGHFILYGSLLGTKVVNTLTNRVLKVYGKDEPFRALGLTLYQGAPDKKSIVTTAMAASDNPLLQEAEARDAMLVSTGSGKVRFYMFTNEEEYVTCWHGRLC